MSSSISSSERGGAGWAGFARLFLAAAALLFAGVLTLAFLLDPYDTGRSPLALKPGVRPQGPRTAAASRGRDLAYRGAIFGNSHIQLISPAELSDQSGIPFVSLIAPATGPKEALALLDWFLRPKRRQTQAVVIGIDEYWCTADPALPNEKPFPFWLYERSLPHYLAGLARFDVIEELQHRLRYLLARAPVRAAPDGYWNYEDDYLRQGFADRPELRARLEQRQEHGGGNAAGPFPAAGRLEAALAGRPDLALVLVRPPAYRSALSVPGSADARADEACRDAFAALAARRPRTALLDWRTDRPENRDPALWFDQTHYRRPLARLVEADIAAALKRLRP